MSLRVGGKGFEYCVLEYSFAFWQWGYVPIRKIPGKTARPEEVIEHMNRVAGFDYFSDQFITEFRPFFYQAMTEMGYYGYKLDAFGKYLKHVDNPVFTFTIPEKVLRSHLTLNYPMRYNIILRKRPRTLSSSMVSTIPGRPQR